MQQNYDQQNQPRQQTADQLLQQQLYGQPQNMHSSRTNEVSNSNLDQDEGFEMEPSQMTPHQSDKRQNISISPAIQNAAQMAHSSNLNADLLKRQATSQDHQRTEIRSYLGDGLIRQPAEESIGPAISYHQNKLVMGQQNYHNRYAAEPSSELHQIGQVNNQQQANYSQRKDQRTDGATEGYINPASQMCPNQLQQQSLESVGSQQMQKTQASEAQSDSQGAKIEPNLTNNAPDEADGGDLVPNGGGPSGVGHYQQSTFSNIMSNIGSARALSMPISGPLSAARGSSAQVTKQQYHAQSQPVFDLEQNMKENDQGDSHQGVHDFREMDRVVKQFNEHGNLKAASSTQFDTQSEAEKLIGRSANAASIPLQFQAHQHQKSVEIQQHQQQEIPRPVSQASLATISSVTQASGQQPGPSPLIRQLSEKIRLQAERLQIMEAYRALCERRILDYDPEHPMPVMPNHLGVVFTPEAGILGDEQTQNQSTADIKRLLALKEQDLMYAKQRNEKLVREIEDIKQKEGSQPGSMQALRKEIDLNEKLQQQIEGYKAKLAELSSKMPLSSNIDESRLSKNIDQKESSNGFNQRANGLIDNDDNQFQGQIKTLREQVSALAEEKNALLDYIDEHVDKNVPLTDRTTGSNQIEKMNAEIADLTSRNAQLTDKLKEVQNINDSLLRNKYSSPNFAQQQIQSNTETTRTDQKDLVVVQTKTLSSESNNQSLYQDNNKLVIQSSDPDPEGTFGAELPMKVQENIRSDSNEQSNENESSVSGLQKQIQTMKQEYESLRQHNMNLQAQLAKAETQNANTVNSAVNQGNLSHRSLTQRSTDRMSEGAHSTNSTSVYKQKIKDLEMRLKASQENIKTLSQTLNETQSELENLIRDHEMATSDLKQQIKENQNMQAVLDSDQRLIEQLKSEKRDVQVENSEFQSKLKKLESESDALKKQAQVDKERSDRLETHIRSLKEDQQRRVEKVATRWEETVAELTRELESAKTQVQNREQMFQSMEQELNKKVQGVDGQTKKERSMLEQRIDHLSHEVKTLQSQKQDKDQKLKNQIRKNEELLGELQELSEAVNALKNDRELTLRSEAVEEKDQIISQFEHFLEHNQKRSLDKIFSQYLEVAELIRDFSKSNALDDALKVKGQDQKPNDDHVSSKALFLQIDGNLKNIAELQMMLHQTKRGQLNQKSANDSRIQGRDDKIEKSLKIMTDLFQDFELLTISLVRWNQNLIQGFKKRTQELNQTQKQLFSETDLKNTLKNQVKKMEKAGAEAIQKDQLVEQQFHRITDQLAEKGKQMEDAYRREDRLGKQNNKLKQQLDALNKDQAKIMKQVLQLITEKDHLAVENNQIHLEMQASTEQLRLVEYQMSAMQQQVDQINLMVDHLRTSMPSQELRDLVAAMQAQIVQRFTLNEEYSQKETQLLAMENQLKQLAKSDQGLSQAVIQLRKDIEASRKDLLQMQIQKKKFDRQNQQIQENLKNCELVERRRHDVAIETEKALAEARNSITEMKKEVAFANATKRDLELALFGLQEQNGMLERELTTMREQFAAGAYYANRTATLGGVLSKMGGGTLTHTPSLGGSAAKESGRKDSLDSVRKGMLSQTAEVHSSSKLEGQRLKSARASTQQTSFDHPTLRTYARPTLLKSQVETPFSGANQANESIGIEADQRGSSMLNYRQINVPSNATLPASQAYVHTQASSRSARYASQGQLQIQDEQENRFDIDDSQITNQEPNHQRSLSLRAQSTAALGQTNQYGQFDKNRAADELLAGEITRMQALMGPSYQLQNQQYRQESSGEKNQQNAYQQQFQSGPAELNAKRLLVSQDYNGQTLPIRPKLPPTYPNKFQNNESQRSNQRIYEEALQRTDSSQVPLLIGQKDSHQSELPQRPTGIYGTEYGTFGGRILLQERLDTDFPTTTTPSLDGLRTVSQSRQTAQQQQSNQINPYPSMQQIHTSQSFSQGGQSEQVPLLPAQSSRNPFSSSLSNKNHHQSVSQPQANLHQLTGTPIFPGLHQLGYGGTGAHLGMPQGYNAESNHQLRQPSADQERINTFARTVSESTLSGPNQQHSPLMPRTASGATQNTTESISDVKTGRGAQEVSSHQKSHSRQMTNTAMSGHNIATGTTSVEKSSPIKADTIMKIRDDLPDAIEDDLDNSLLKSELLERNDGQTSIDETGGPNPNLQDKLSQVKNVFTAIRQNLHEGSTDAREASSERTLQ